MRDEGFKLGWGPSHLLATLRDNTRPCAQPLSLLCFLLGNANLLKVSFREDSEGAVFVTSSLVLHWNEEELPDVKLSVCIASWRLVSRTVGGMCEERPWEGACA